MPLQCFVDTFNIGTGAVASTVVRTGYGFQPKACLYWWSGRTESTTTFARKTLQVGAGMASGPTARACVTSLSQDTPTTMVTNRRHDAANVIACTTTADATDGSADLQSFDADGQTLEITDQFTTDLRVQCLALGGTDLTDALVVQFSGPGANGNQDTTTVGFQPDALVLLSSIQDVASGTVQNFTGQVVLGVATGPSNQGVVALTDADNVGTSQTSRYTYGGECLASCDFAAANIERRATFDSFLVNGFRLNWLEFNSAGFQYFALALKGGRFAVGHCVTSTTINTTIPVTGLGFAPSGLWLMSAAAAEDVQDTSRTQATLALGAATSPSNRACQSVVSEHAVATAVCASSTREDACLQLLNSGSVSAGVVDVQSMDTDGFTLIMDVADVTTTKYVTYLAVGSVPAAAPGLANYATTFTETTSVLVLGSLHAMGHRFLLVTAYNNAAPRQVLPSVAIGIDATSFGVGLSSPTSITGTLVINGFAGDALSAPNLGFSFTASTFQILGVSHGAQTRALLTGVYTSDAVGTRILPASLTIDPVSFGVTVTLSTISAGTLVVNAFTR